MRILPFLISLCFLAACQPSPKYQKHVTIPSGGWQYAFQPEFKIQIQDTNAAYQMFFLIRHTNAYPYSNIWLRLKTRQPGDSSFQQQRFEVTLAAPTAVLPDGSLSGGWLGRGMGEIWEQRMALNDVQHPVYFPKSGEYVFKLSQDMRVNPLPEVIQVGLRVEKIGAKPRSEQ